MKHNNSAQLSAKEIFILAVGLNSAAEREAILNEYCSADPDLQKQVTTGWREVFNTMCL